MIVEDLVKYEGEKSSITVYMETDKSTGEIYFLKHIESNDSDEEQITRYSLETFMAEYYMIEKFIKGNLVNSRPFFKQVMKLKGKQND